MNRRIQAELGRYLESAFDLGALGPGTFLPLPDEPFVEIWEGWAEEARQQGAFAVLSRQLPQLRFPIREGISQTGDYRAATLKGVPAGGLEGATGLELERPDAIELEIHPSPAPCPARRAPSWSAASTTGHASASCGAGAKK